MINLSEARLAWSIVIPDAEVQFVSSIGSFIYLRHRNIKNTQTTEAITCLSGRGKILWTRAISGRLRSALYSDSEHILIPTLK